MWASRLSWSVSEWPLALSMLPMLHAWSSTSNSRVYFCLSVCVCLNCLLNNWYRTMFYLCLLTLSLTIHCSEQNCLFVFFFFFLPHFSVSSVCFQSDRVNFATCTKCVHRERGKQTGKPIECFVSLPNVIAAQFNFLQIYTVSACLLEHSTFSVNETVFSKTVSCLKWLHFKNCRLIIE